ncbi:MAG: DUF2971 domain-containing protein [Bacteroidetes bacterium]|nr:DUF2971 domain-containing protein [Bacteroidota bacterium]
MEIDFYKQYVGEMPNKVYKFSSVDDNLIKTLEESYLWLSKPSDFNDPFDCDSNFISFNKNTDKKLSFEITLETVSKAWGVCCFTQEYDSILMWSHYANKHKGVCLGFDPRTSTETFLLLKVDYVKDFESSEYFDSKFKAIPHMMITKAGCWEYEQEMRIFKDFNGELQFPKNALKEVIFGCKATEKDIKRVIEVIKEKGYKNVAFRRAVKKKDEFKLDYFDLSV